MGNTVVGQRDIRFLSFRRSQEQARKLFLRDHTGSRELTTGLCKDKKDHVNACAQTHVATRPGCTYVSLEVLYE